MLRKTEEITTLVCDMQNTDAFDVLTYFESDVYTSTFTIQWLSMSSQKDINFFIPNLNAIMDACELNVFLISNLSLQKFCGFQLK